MVKIRLTQTGKKNAKTYRIIAVDSEKKRDGEFLQILGHYNPQPNPSIINLDIELVDKWLSKGAQMSERVGKLYDLVKNNKVK